MDDTISNVYNELLERGISITDLYIYDCLVNDGCVGAEGDIEELMSKIKNNYANDYEYRGFVPGKNELRIVCAMQGVVKARIIAVMSFFIISWGCVLLLRKKSNLPAKIVICF